MRRLVVAVSLAILFTLTAAPPIQADTIFMNDGSLLVVERAWLDGDNVKYQTSRGVQTLPKSNVREIQEQMPTPSAGNRHWGFAEASGAPAAKIVRSNGSTGSDFPRETLGRLRDNLGANPSDPRSRAELIRALNSVALLEMSQGDLPGAMSSLEEALSIDGRNAGIMVNLAIVHLEMSDYKAAEDLLRTALGIDNTNKEIYYLLGEAYYAQEKIDQAISQWTAGLALGPHEQMAKSLEKARREARVHADLDVQQSTHFILRYDRKVSDQRLGDEILNTLESIYTRLTHDLTSRAPATIAVILYPDQSYFDITRAANWTGAIFDGKIRVPTKGLTSVTPRLTGILTHELTHSFIASLPGSGCPAWFNEGVAQFEEGQSAAHDRKALARLHRDQQLPSLGNLQQSFVSLSSDAAEVAYAQSLSVVEYLVATAGRSSIPSILDLMAQNYNFDNAFKTALKKTVPALEAAWQQDLAR
jgi:tetratricopeptide (TPR) repeat protein